MGLPHTSEGERLRDKIVKALVREEEHVTGCFLGQPQHTQTV